MNFTRFVCRNILKANNTSNGSYYLKFAHNDLHTWTAKFPDFVKTLSFVPKVLSTSPDYHSYCTESVGKKSEVRLDLKKSNSNNDFRRKASRKHEDEKTERNYYAGRPRKDPDLATSLEYMNSDAYKITYGNKPVWFHFRRNFRGHYYPIKARRTCVVEDKLTTGNPCPVCRDEFLLLHHENLNLLKQFVDPLSGKLLHHKFTGLCRKQLRRLAFEVEVAHDKGFIEMPLEFRFYDYRQHYSPDQLSSELLDLPELAPKPEIPHAQKVEVKFATTEIVPPRVPNRYLMEEARTPRGIRMRDRFALEMQAFLPTRKKFKYPKHIV